MWADIVSERDSDLVSNLVISRLTDFYLIGYLLLERKLDFEAREPEEVAIIGTQGSAVFDGERRKMSVHDQPPAYSCPF